MAYCMTYNNIVLLYPKHISMLGKIMINCIQCNELFYARHKAKACSLKCKILSNVNKTVNGCWLYKNSASGPYGKIRWNKKWHSAHRVSYEQFVGPIEKDKWVCHKCDVPKCVNPEHLFIGSASDNRRDCLQKGRSNLLGEKNHFAKFTNDQVAEIRILKKEGFTYERLQRIFNCSMPYILYVVKNRIRLKE